ncbi:hypothetical protein [Kribbella sp. HUAS MG21]|uniref:Uncharacterized protein n=1 Tax=Kribbella sp. HUAS MG21 TaxID=3160966 RepID=A0AAU7T624_9ACTN
MVTGSWWEETVYAEPPLAGLGRCDASEVFDWLAGRFPVSETKIDWGRVDGRHVHRRIVDDTRIVEVVYREVLRRLRAGGVVEHVGDGLSPYGIRFDGDNAASVVGALLEIPEHHYFLAGDRSWIAVVTTEGDLDIVDQLGSV